MLKLGNINTKYSDELKSKKMDIFYKTKQNGNKYLFAFYLKENTLDIGYISGVIYTNETHTEDDIESIERSVHSILNDYKKGKNNLNILKKKNNSTLSLLEKELLLKIKTRYITDDITITMMEINPNYRGRKLGQLLFKVACDYAKKNYNIKKISLDDDTDNAWNLKNNIYIKLGMWYINEEPEPEMEGLIDIVLSK